MKFKKESVKANLIRIFFSLIAVGYFLSAITDTYPDLQLPLEIFIGMLIFIIVNTAARFIPIDEILTRIL